MPCGRNDAVAALVMALALLCACRQAPPPPAVTAGTPAADTPGQVPHGDHNPHHGGVVMMKGDLHYEVVIDPSGRRHRLYFSDAIREDLPATIASAVSLTLHRRPGADERVAMTLDESGESWVGHGGPVTPEKDATVGVSFTIRGEPYSIDLPLAAASPAPQ
jgi:hypothetical protein